MQVRVRAAEPRQRRQVLGVMVKALHDLPVPDVGEGVVDVRQPIGGDLRGIDERVLHEHVADDDGAIVSGAWCADEACRHATERNREKEAAQH